MTNTGPVGVYLMTTFTDQLLLPLFFINSSASPFGWLLNGANVRANALAWKASGRDPYSARPSAKPTTPTPKSKTKNATRS